MRFAGTNTRTCESQRTLPIGFGSPKFTCLVLAKFNSRAVPPGMPASPQEVRSREVTLPTPAGESVPAAGMEVRYQSPGPLLYPADRTLQGFLPAVSCVKFYLQDGFKRKERKKAPKTNKKTTPQFSWMKNYPGFKSFLNFSGSSISF